MVPHAGYVYSGSTAAKAYRLLKNHRDVLRRIVLLGPAHRVWIQGIAFPGVEAFETPLGRIPLAVKQIRGITPFPRSATP
ncbi:MAG: AmmeMemoRadiSam system protein B [bacterium]